VFYLCSREENADLSGFEAIAPTATRSRPIEPQGTMRATETGREASLAKAGIDFDKTEIKVTAKSPGEGSEEFSFGIAVTH